MRCLRCILLFALTAAVLSVCAAAAFVAFVPGWLAAGEVPERADAIVVLTGAPERVLLSRAAPDRHTPLLARFGLQAMPEEEAGLRILTMSGVPARQIEILGAGSKSTLEEMESLKAHLHGPARLLVVTSPLHVRRAGMIARSVLHGSGLETIFVATPCERIPARWWTDQDAAPDVLLEVTGVVLEVTKIAFYLFGGAYRAIRNPS